MGWCCDVHLGGWTPSDHRVPATACNMSYNVLYYPENAKQIFNCPRIRFCCDMRAGQRCFRAYNAQSNPTYCPQDAQHADYTIPPTGAPGCPVSCP
jgi:hypothetical protein